MLVGAWASGAGGCADNLKLTFPIAAATFQMAWGIASLPGSGAGVSQQVFTEIRWATDYLLACFGGSSLVTQACLSALLVGLHTFAALSAVLRLSS